MFHHSHAKLIQRDVTDINGNLIVPWDMYDKLQPGTFVLMKVQLIMFKMSNAKQNGIKKVNITIQSKSTYTHYYHQFYQFHVDHICILATSEEKIETQEQPTLLHFMTQTKAKRDATDDALDAIFPTKRPKAEKEPIISPSSQPLASTSLSHKTPSSHPPKKVSPRQQPTSQPKSPNNKDKMKASDIPDNTQTKIPSDMNIDPKL